MGTVLVVDDEETVRQTAQNILERYGYKVLIAADGREAVEIFRQAPQAVSVVMLDLTMPVMSGEEALRALKAIRADVPILLATGFDEVEAANRLSPEISPAFCRSPIRHTAWPKPSNRRSPAEPVPLPEPPTCPPLRIP